jgi:DNA-binding transcriptional ArsR family regulator
MPAIGGEDVTSGPTQTRWTGGRDQRYGGTNGGAPPTACGQYSQKRHIAGHLGKVLAILRIVCKNVRIMSKFSPLLSALFNGTVQAVLGATILQPARQWYLSDLASFLGVGPSTLQRTLSKLTGSGILLRNRNGNRVYYRADPACPILGELSAILTKTSGIAEPLRAALMPLAGKITVAFIHGSVAEARERSESDIDVIIVGVVANADVVWALRPLQERLGRDINATRYTPGEFAAKVAEGHHFLTSVLRKPKLFLIGGEHELEQISGRQAGGAGANQQTGVG